ncbi:MAG: hypothetical protein ACYC0L_06135 [Thermoleophilia bacterium]
MPLPSSLTPIRAFAQANYPSSFLFIDRIGELAQSVRQGYEEAAIGPEGVDLQGKKGEIQLKASDGKFWMAERWIGGNPRLTEFAEFVSEKFMTMANLLDLEDYNRTGVRIYFLEPKVSVEEAVQTFQKRHIDYRNEPFNAIPGLPTKCMITFAAKDEEYTRQLTVTAIKDEREISGANAGGILMDLDVSREKPIPISKYEATLKELVEVSIKTISNFYNSLREEKLPEKKVAES